MNKAYGLAAVCGLCASALMAATPALSINDGVATISKSTALTEDDQSTLDGLQSVLVDSTFAGTSSAPVFYAAKGQTVTIPAVNFANESTVYCGKMDSGTLRFASSIAHKSGQYLDLFGPEVKWMHLGGDEAFQAR